MGWWITLGVLTLLAILPLGISIKYNAEGPLVRLILGPVKLMIIPAKKKPKKEKKPEKKAAKKESKPAVKQIGADKPGKVPGEQPAKKEEKGGSLLDFLPLVKELFRFLGDFRRKLRVNVLELKLIMAADDPCDLAVNYGRAWAAVGNLLPKMDQYFVIKKRNIEVECDFVAEETKVIARLELTITLGRLLSAVVRFGFRTVKEFIKIKKSQKGGVTT